MTGSSSGRYEDGAVVAGAAAAAQLLQLPGRVGMGNSQRHVTAQRWWQAQELQQHQYQSSAAAAVCPTAVVRLAATSQQWQGHGNGRVDHRLVGGLLLMGGRERHGNQHHHGVFDCYGMVC